MVQDLRPHDLVINLPFRSPPGERGHTRASARGGVPLCLVKINAKERSMPMNARWKKRILCLTVLVICLATLATGTMAYFVAEETAYSVITTGCLYMELKQETADGRPLPEEPVMNVVPATAADQVAYVRNKGSVPFFTRVLVEKKITPAEGSDAQLDAALVMLNINEEYWTEKNGFYFYKRILRPGQETAPLYTEVGFAPEMGNEYMDAKVEIRVLAQAVQSANNGTDATQALGWSEAVKTLIVDENDLQ